VIFHSKSARLLLMVTAGCGGSSGILPQSGMIDVQAPARAQTDTDTDGATATGPFAAITCEYNLTGLDLRGISPGTDVATPENGVARRRH
jgi:hypothetical protein